MGKKPNFAPLLAPFRYTSSETLFQAIINKPKLRKWQKKPNLGSIVINLTQIWDYKTFFIGFTYASSWKLFQAITLCKLQKKQMNHT